MTRRILTITTVVGAAFVLVVPAAWGNGQPYRDAGDATSAKLTLQSSPIVFRDAGDATSARLTLQSSPIVFRDAGDATSAKLTLQGNPQAVSAAVPVSAPDSGTQIEWLQIGVGFGVGILLALGLGLAVRVTRIRQLAH
jgi:hypothetical protein